MRKKKIEEIIYEFTEEDIKTALRSFYDVKFPDGVVNFMVSSRNVAPPAYPPVYRGKAVFIYHKEVSE